MGAFAIAAVSLYFNFRQHRRANREQEARARFDVSVRTVDADEEGIRWTDANTTTQITRIAIGLKNIGDRPAGETLLNILVPEGLEYARWSGPGGEEIPDGKQTAPTPELLQDADGEERIASKHLGTTWRRIGMRSHYEKYVTLPVQLPPRETGLQQGTVPVRIKVQADELPDDIDEYVIDYTVRVVRRPG
jgi:hypothetical protein